MNIAQKLEKLQDGPGVAHAEHRRDAGSVEYESWFAPSAGELEYQSWLAKR